MSSTRTTTTDALRAATQAASHAVGGLDRHDVVAHLNRTFTSPTYKPPMLPQVAIELLQLSQQPDVRFEDAVALLEKDPVLATRVLSIAQSSAYAARSPILTLHQATVRLGLKTMRDVVLEAALNLKVFRVPGFEGAMERLSRHSTATAHVMRAVCRRTRVETEFAFLCGLIHDVGFAASLLALGNDPTWRTSTFEELAPVLDEVHEEASGVLARLWRLPEPLQRMVSNHHEAAPNGKIELVNASLIVSEQLAWEAGAGLAPPPKEANPRSLATPEPPLDGVDVNWSGVVDEARNCLGMDELGLGAARAEAFQIVEALGMGQAPAPSRRR